MNYFECPIMRTLEVIGGKWKPLILHFLRVQPCRTSELLRQLPEVSGKMLTQQLRELERDGVIVRTVYGEVPPRVEYALSDLGQTLLPVLDAMCAWGREHPAAEVPKATAKVG